MATYYQVGSILIPSSFNNHIHFTAIELKLRQKNIKYLPSSYQGDVSIYPLMKIKAINFMRGGRAKTCCKMTVSQVDLRE